MVMLIMNIPYFDGYGDYEKNHSDEDIYPSLWPQTGLGSTHAPPKKNSIIMIINIIITSSTHAPPKTYSLGKHLANFLKLPSF